MAPCAPLYPASIGLISSRKIKADLPEDLELGAVVVEGEKAVTWYCREQSHIANVHRNLSNSFKKLNELKKESKPAISLIIQI
jgi:hypothetical protein